MRNQRAAAAHDATVPPNGALAAEAPVSQKSSGPAGATALVAPVEAVYARRRPDSSLEGATLGVSEEVEADAFPMPAVFAEPVDGVEDDLAGLLFCL